MQHSRAAAFFDLDLTLIDVNSGLLWARHEQRLGNISRGQMARAIFWHGMYRLALIDMEVAFERAMAHYRGVTSAELEQRTREWFERDIEHRFRERAEAAREVHRKNNQLLVILTNSSCYQAKIACERWGFEHYLANNFPTDDGDRLVGSFERPLCYGPGKVERAEKWAQEHEVDLARSFFYSDSYSDLPMLERVGQPRVVTPDPRLKRAAKKRGWPILRW